MSETVSIAVYSVEGETDLAVQYALSDDPLFPELTWFPKSVHEPHGDDAFDHKGEGTIEVAEWFAEKEGLV